MCIFHSLQTEVKQTMSTSSDPQEMFLDILTKDEKEALVNKKMEEMRMKNEQLQKRHAVCFTEVELVPYMY